MSNIDRRRVERHRDEGLYVPKVQEEKKGKEKFSELPPEKSNKILFATFFHYVKELIDNFSSSKKLAGKIIDLQMIAQNLDLFKRRLAKLEKKDLSQSADYATSLSEIWRSLMEDFENMEIMERKNLQKVAHFRQLIDVVKNYPPESEHRFGYYLLKQAGKDWLPFPFIDILSDLHKQHQKDAEKSTLTKWKKLIDKTIESLKGKPFL